ncbi:MAG: hypothetical protein AAB915_02445 [Patescibacteria group bacterium]
MAEPNVNVSVMVDNSPPVRTPDGGWKFEMWGIAQRSRGNPQSGQVIEFFVNDIKVHEVQTEDDGRTTPREVFIPAGVLAVRIEAQPAGDATRRSAGKIVRWEGTAPKPATVKPFVRAEQDKSLVVFLVLDGNENPVSGEPVYIMDKDDPRMVYQLDTPTDRHGFVRCEIPMPANREKDIVVLVRGIQESIRLYPQPQPEEE